MTVEARVLGIGVVDELGLASSTGVRAAWSGLGRRVPGAARALQQLFDKRDETLRRLDATSRALVFAAEASGLDAALSEAQREDTGLVFETRWGSLDADRKFVRSLDQPMVNGAVFPYTLPSLSLGEIALRHGLRGPTLCLSVDEGQRGVAWREATAMLSTSELEHVLVGSVDVLEDPPPGLPSSCRVSVALLSSTATGTAVAPLPDDPASAFDELVRTIR